MSIDEYIIILEWKIKYNNKELLEGKKIILISPSQPLITCNKGETGISNFNGFEINLINEIMI